MNLKILLPFEVFEQTADVLRIVAQTGEGTFGLLPHRLDCVAALTPGIFVYETAKDGEVFLATDEGVLIKTGQDVLVSVHRALKSADLDRLHETVDQEFLTLDQQSQNVRSVMAKLETGFLRRVTAFQHE